MPVEVQVTVGGKKRPVEEQLVVYGKIDARVRRRSGWRKSISTWRADVTFEACARRRSLGKCSSTWMDSKEIRGRALQVGGRQRSQCKSIPLRAAVEGIEEVQPNVDGGKEARGRSLQCGWQCGGPEEMN